MKKFVTLAFALTLIVSTTSCTAAWLTTLETYTQIAGPILIQLLDIVAIAKGQPPNLTLQAKITQDDLAVKTLVQSISSADSQNLPSTCAAFNQAVSTLSADLTTIEQLANTGTKVSGEIVAAMGIAQAAIQEIEAPIQACQSSPTSARAMVVLQAASVKVKSPKDVVARFNKLVDSKHQVHVGRKWYKLWIAS